MESRFAHLRQRDSSVSMLRVRMSRRRSQTQKENRERAVNSRRQLEEVPELDCSSINTSVMSVSIQQQSTTTTVQKAPDVVKPEKNAAVKERMERLERYKQEKALLKEKNMREKQSKRVFKVGLYQPKDSMSFVPLPLVPKNTTTTKETTVKTTQSTRVTRSTKQQQVHKPQMELDQSTVVKKVEPLAGRTTRRQAATVQLPPAGTTTRTRGSKASHPPQVEPKVQALTTRTENKSRVAAVVPVVRDQPAADVRSTRTRAKVNLPPPPTGRGKNKKVTTEEKDQVTEAKEPETKGCEQSACPAIPTPPPEEEDRMVEDPSPSEMNVAPSFAPQGFMFQAPAGLPVLASLSKFIPEPLTPRSADAFLTPSSSFNLPPVPSFDSEPPAEPSKPSPKSPQPTLPTMAPAAVGPQEPQHDVPYFRSEVSNETERLTSLCCLWEPKVDDVSIPEEKRDCMRTAVGQARLLMKERFAQFMGLVDDCDLGRGEKITTCTDLQGFWDMVYYQVEDVNKKFDALKEAEARGWVEEHKPPPRQRRVVKKPAPAAEHKPAGTNAAAKSRLAAAKAAMKAAMKAKQQQEAEAQAQADEDGSSGGDAVPTSETVQPQAEPSAAVVFHGGFFQVESPAKPPGSVRRSTRLSASVRPQASPFPSLTPGRVTRRSLAMLNASPLPKTTPARLTHTPARLPLTPAQTTSVGPKSQPSTPQVSQSSKEETKVSLCFSPVKEAPSDNMQPEECPVNHLETVCGQGDAITDCQKTNECVNDPETTEPIPSGPLVQQSEEAAEAVSVTPAQPSMLPISPRLCLSPSSHAPESSTALSLTLSPCSPSTTPARQSSADVSLPLQSPPCSVPSSPPKALPPVLSDHSMVDSPDSSIPTGGPWLDFERYLKPTERISLSPRGDSAGLLSPSVADIEMESPTAQRGDEMMTPMAPLDLPLVFSPQMPQVQTAASDLLLYTPDMKDRIRESVCPSDLMVFTPPSKR